MAWYLLGRDYEAQGKQGKALYCYAQAGEIYEAYENQKVTLPPEELEPIQSWVEGKRRRRLPRYARAVAMLLLLIAGLLFSSASRPDAVEEAEAPPLPQGVTSAQVQATKVYYLAERKSPEKVSTALQEMLLKERVASFAILARGIPLGETSWIGWLKKPELLLTVEAKQDASQQQIVYHDAASCNCLPSDPAPAAGIVSAWMTKQEQELVLRSAVAASIRLKGQAPEQSAQLTAAYPNNSLPGLTPYMQELYEKEKAAMGTELAAWVQQTPQPPQQVSQATPGSPGPGPGAAGLTKPLNEPLRIIVDKTAHRLAVVSGSIVVRSYPVGLGGPRTPEGTFAITEKVRNPNGKSNGDFGSRGMTLSDTQYAIHGTNQPSSVGKDQSAGCVRMLKEDVEELFDMVPLGTPVTIGKGMLPSDVVRSGKPFQLPVASDETNPGKVYHWLN
ncbi:L,D-transpeptidase [Paenibacillus cremeus]|uniref:L,D-transpeptidase n=2 Tax=Paenibacillus cremeus TaxID=2163881 RepID=A0A559K8A9_9BACL|nr:L,D-transpeptidase [Paenibacillus cremeus]